MKSKETKEHILKWTEETKITNFEKKVVICKKTNSIDVLKLATNHSADHIVYENSDHYLTEVESSIQIIDTPDTFYNFPLSAMLDPENCSLENDKRLNICHIEFSKSSEKQKTIDKVAETLKSYSRRSSLIQNLKTVTDELFMNALYSAPFELTESQMNRSEPVELEEKQECSIDLGIKGDRVALVCVDQFGSLNIQKLLNRILTCFENGVIESMNFGSGGAGIGSFLIYNLCNSMYLGVRKGERTVIGCVFCLGNQHIRQNNKNKNIHLNRDEGRSAS